MVQAHARELLNQKESNRQRLLRASDRLAGALDLLEERLRQMSVSESRDERQHEQLTFFERENASLKAERAKLNRAVEELEVRYDELQKTAGNIYNRLDDTIKRLTQIIDH